MKTIGVYRSRHAAEEAVKRAATAPGFSDHPHLIDPTAAQDSDGFTIDENRLDLDQWQEGCDTVSDNE